MADRQQFTDEQLNTIRESDEFKKFQESKEEATVEDYLSSNEAYTFWAEKLLDGQGKDSSEASHEYEPKELDDATHDAIRDYQMQMDGRISEDEGQAKKFTPHEYEPKELNDETHDAIREYQMKMDGRIGEEEVPVKNQAKKGLTIDENTTENSNENLATAVMNDTDTVWGGDDDDDLSEGEKDVLTVTGVTKEQYKEMSPQERGDLHLQAARIRSADSDQNAMKFNMQIVDTLHAMKEISDDELSKAQGSVREAALLASRADGLDEKKRMEFDIRFADKLTKNPELLEVTPPSILATSHDALKKFVETAKKRNPDADLSAQEAQLELINNRIDVLTDSFAKEEYLYFADVTNIADTYQGYMDMMASREKDLEEKDPRRATIQSNRTKLDGMIAEYDDLWNLPDGMSAEEAEKRFDEAYKLAPDLQLSSETLALVSQYQFVDKQHKETVDQKRLDKANSDLDQYLGTMYVETHPDEMVTTETWKTKEYQDWEAEYLKNTEDKDLQALLAEREAAQKPVVEDVMAPIPQFIDPKDGSKHVEYKEGFVVDPEGKLATVIKLTINDEVMKSLGSKEPITKEGLEQGLNENLKYKLFAIHNSEETLQGVAEAKDKFTNKEYAEEFIQKLEYQQEFADRKANGETQEQILAGIDNEIKQHLGMDLDQYLGTMYVETHPDEMVTTETWKTKEYKDWEADFLKNTEDKKLKGLLVKKEAAQKPMQISPEGYEAAIDHQVDAVDAFAHRLAQKTGDPKAPVISKLYDKVADIDKLSGARTDGRPSKAEIRKQLAIQFGTKALSSFGMASVFTMATRAIGASYGTTAATLTGVGVGIGATAYMIYKRKKQAKKLGQKYGWKEFRKDHAAHVAIATSACAGAAAACSMTGQPELAATFGTAAIVIGSGGSALEGYTQARKGGLGMAESLAWGGAMALATYGGAQIGRMAGNAAVDAINKAWADNTIFQNREETTIEKTEVKYKEGAVANAEKTISKWDTPEFKQNLENSFANAENSTILQDSHLNPNRVALMAHYLGLDGTVDVTQHVQGGSDVTTSSHKAFYNYDSFMAGNIEPQPTVDMPADSPEFQAKLDAYKAIASITPEMYDAMQSAIAPDGTVHLTPDAVKGFEIMDNHVVGPKGEITLPGHNGIDVQTDHVLGDNMSKGADGMYNVDKNGDVYTTWGGDGGATETKTITIPGDPQYTDKPGVTAIWGGVGFMNKIGQGLRKRFGALKDKVTGKNPAGKGAEVDAPVPGGKGTEKLGDNITKKPGKDKDPTPPNNGGSGKGLEVGGIVPPAPGKDKEKGPTPDNPNLAALQGDNVFYEDTSGDVAYNEVEGLNKDEAKKEGITVAGVTKEEKAPVSKEQVQEKTVSKEDSKKEAPKKETEQKKSPQVSLMTPTGMIPILTQEQETTGRKEEPKEKVSEEKPKKKSLFGRLFGGSKRTKEEAPKKETEQKKAPQVSLMTPTGMIPVLVQDTTGKTEAAFKEAAKTTEKETVKKSKWRSFSVARALGNLKDRVGQWQEKRAAEKEQARKEKERIEHRKNFDYDKAEFGEFTMNAVGNENPNLQAGDVQAAKENGEQSKTGAVKERKAEVEARKAGQQLSNEELMAAMSGNTGGAYDANQEEKPAQAPAKAGKETTLEERLMMMHNQDYTK